MRERARESENNVPSRSGGCWHMNRSLVIHLKCDSTPTQSAEEKERDVSGQRIDFKKCLFFNFSLSFSLCLSLSVSLSFFLSLSLLFLPLSHVSLSLSYMLLCLLLSCGVYINASLMAKAKKSLKVENPIKFGILFPFSHS